MKVKLLMLVMAMVLFSSCGMFRKVFKAKEYSKLETSSKSTKDSTGLTIDKSIITIKERVDTTVIIPGHEVQQDTYLNMDSLVNGLTAVKNDLVDVTLQLNPVTGILSVIAKIKPQKVEVKIDRETVKQNDITQQSYQSELWKAALKQSSGSSVIQKEPVNVTWNILFIAMSIAVICGVIYWLRRKP